MQESIKKDVAKLRAELQELDSLALEDRIKLDKLVRDIESHAKKNEQNNALNEQMEAALARFETSHPTVSGVLRSIMNTLSNMGV